MLIAGIRCKRDHVDSVAMGSRKPLLVLILLIVYVQADDQSVFAKIKSSFAYAGKVLGLDRAAEVAKLVSDAFGQKVRRGETGEQESFGTTLFSGFLRVLGFDTKRIGAIAVNAIILIAQIISTSLAAPIGNVEQTRANSAHGLESPIDWLLGTGDSKRYIRHVKDPELPNRIIEYLMDNPREQKTECLQLLVCKSAPFIWGMQKAIKLKPKQIRKGKRVLSEYLPSYEEVTAHGDKCEEKFPNCRLTA